MPANNIVSNIFVSKASVSMFWNSYEAIRIATVRTHLQVFIRRRSKFLLSSVQHETIELRLVISYLIKMSQLMFCSKIFKIRATFRSHWSLPIDKRRNHALLLTLSYSALYFHQNALSLMWHLSSGWFGLQIINSHSFWYEKNDALGKIVYGKK